MLRVGLTGGIGSGKSTVARVFEVLGIPIFNSDIQAAVIMHTNSKVKQGLVKEFGEDIYHAGILNKALLRKLIFNNEKNKNFVNNLVHPEVRKAYQLYTETHNNVPYVMQEAAILFESGAYKIQDKNITVVANRDIRIKRITERDGIDESMVKNIMNQQLPEEEKKKLSDFTIDNNGTMLVIPQVLTIHKQLLKETESRIQN